MPVRLFLTQLRHLPRGVPRMLAVVLLGLQALLWGGGSIIEARAAAESLTRASHIEDQATTVCPPFHSHLECLICRTLSGGAGAASGPALVPVNDGTVDGPVTVGRQVSDRDWCGTVGSRAPPRVANAGHSTV